MARIAIDRGACVGAGLCVVAAGAVFDQSEEDGLVMLLTDSPRGGEAEAAAEAARRCPSRAIRLLDDA